MKALIVTSDNHAISVSKATVAEPAFLQDCIRHFFQPGLPFSIPPILDWEKLVAIARNHAVESLMYSALRDSNKGIAPTQILNQLHQSSRETARFNLALGAELTRILALLAEASIDVCTFKGPVLAKMLYGNLAMRSFSDLDLLVHPEDIARVRVALEASGYCMTTPVHWTGHSALLRARECQLSFENSQGVIVDVHWHLIPSYWPKPFDENHIWAERLAIPLAGATAMTLSPESLLLFLCAHGALHVWARAGWICDVARLIQIETEMNWPAVFAQARQTQTCRMLALGLQLAQNLLGSEIPPPASEWVVQNPGVQRLEMAIRKRFLECAPITPPGVESARLSVDMCDRSSQKMLFLTGTVIGPSEAEFQALPLPAFLFGLYYLYRPLRLIVRYIGRALGWG